MGEKKLNQIFVTDKTLRDIGITWSRKTLERRIAGGLVASKDGADIVIYIADLEKYLKKRRIQNP